MDGKVITRERCKNKILKNQKKRENTKNYIYKNMSEENEQKLKEYGKSYGNTRKMRSVFKVVYSIKKLKKF